MSEISILVKKMDDSLFKKHVVVLSEMTFCPCATKKREKESSLSLSESEMKKNVSELR